MKKILLPSPGFESGIDPQITVASNIWEVPSSNPTFGIVLKNVDFSYCVMGQKWFVEASKDVRECLIKDLLLKLLLMCASCHHLFIADYASSTPWKIDLEAPAELLFSTLDTQKYSNVPNKRSYAIPKFISIKWPQIQSTYLIRPRPQMTWNGLKWPQIASNDLRQSHICTAPHGMNNFWTVFFGESCM